MTTNVLGSKLGEQEEVLDRLSAAAEEMAGLVLTERELATIVKLSPRTLQRMRQQGDLTFWFYAGRQVRYLRQRTLVQLARVSRRARSPLAN